MKISKIRVKKDIIKLRESSARKLCESLRNKKTMKVKITAVAKQLPKILQRNKGYHSVCATMDARSRHSFSTKSNQAFEGAGVIGGTQLWILRKFLQLLL